jgi:hypothetical protein
MTNEQEKSDLFIVAMKLANKPGRSGAESVEPRKRTEGNTGEQHMPDSEPGKRVPGARPGYEEPLVGFDVNHPRWSPVRELRTPG